jgi:hypothetical protein
MDSGASWTIEYGALRVGRDYGITLIACGPPADAQDHWWINFLTASPRALWDTSSRLVIYANDIVVTLREEPRNIVVGGRPPH